jgi:beta-barrel assembly-enhancing protease
MRSRFLSAVGAVVASSTLVFAQTKITPPSNKYTPAQDVQLGLQAASEARQQLPIMRDDLVTSFVEDVGHRLVAAIPPELQHKEFRYTFETVNVREINAFALPGGPMFVNRGMIEAAKTEGEVAGVMAHELSHVVLRHGTAQASKATKYEVGQVAGAVLGAIIGGGWGQVISQGTQFGLGAAFLRFSREYEKQADLLGAQMMARAGYDPIDMANMFRTIEQQSGNGGPEFLSDHPNPGNRIEYITAEARTLQVTNPVRDTATFERLQAHLSDLPPARGDSRTARAGGGRAPGGAGIEAPDARFRTYTEGNLFRVSVPSNWQELPANDNAVWFAPEGAYGTGPGGQPVFTHGMQIGVGRVQTSNLQQATQALLNSLAQGNPNLQQAGRAQRVSFADRNGLAVQLRNTSDATGEPERIVVRTAMLQEGVLIYSVSVVPEREAQQYAPVFNRVAQSVEINQ